MKNGEIIVVGQEEGFLRIKNDIGYPKRAIDFCLNEANISTSQISQVAYTTKGFPSIFTKAKHRVNFSIKDYMDYYGKKYKGNDNKDEKLKYLKWLREDNKTTSYFRYDFFTDELFQVLLLN